MSKDTAIKAKDGKDKKEKFAFFKKIARFFKDLKSEFKKVVWPTKKQVIQNTGVVVAFMAVVAISLMILDWVFLNIMRAIF